jgi:hypothetical protein
MPGPPATTHIGRSWASHEIEDNCPCPQAACGLVPLDQVSPACDQHPPARAKSIRRSHPAEQCPGEAG